MSGLAAPAVTVVLACHDDRNWDHIVAALDSLEAQSVPPAAVVVAVDHNPGLGDRLRTTGRSIVVVDNDGVHRGASATRNAGAALCRTPLIAFLDDDEVAHPEWLARLCAPFVEPAVVGTGGRYVPAWEAGRPTWFPDEFGWVVGSSHTGQPTTTSTVRNVWSGNMAVRRATFEQVGGFREGFGKRGSVSRPEDTDLCLRMSATAPSGHWVYEPAAQISHFVSRRRSTFGFFLHRCFNEGRGKVDLQRNLGTTDALGDERAYVRRVLPLGVVRQLARGRAGAGPAVAIVAGLVSAVAGAGLACLQPARAPKLRRSHDGA